MNEYIRANIIKFFQTSSDRFKIFIFILQYCISVMILSRSIDSQCNIFVWEREHILAKFKTIKFDQNFCQNKYANRSEVLKSQKVKWKNDVLCWLIAIYHFNDISVDFWFFLLFSLLFRQSHHSSRNVDNFHKLIFFFKLEWDIRHN